MQAFDPEILNDFLTESGELLEEFDADLVELESTPTDPDLLNKVFRALHTIKGSASFLALSQVVSIAHAAEDALNTARRGEIVIDRVIMDMLLEGVDLLKKQFSQLEEGEPLTEPTEELLNKLRAVGEGQVPGADAAANLSSDESTPASAEPTQESGVGAPKGELPLALSQSKSDLLEFMVVDLEESLDDIDIRLGRIINGVSEDVADDATQIVEICDSLARTAEFFEFDQMTSLVGTIGAAIEHIAELDDEAHHQLLPRLAGVMILLRKQAKGLRDNRILWWDVDTLAGCVADLILDHDLADEAMLPEGADGEAALIIDHVFGTPEIPFSSQLEDASTQDSAVEPSAQAAAQSAPSANAKEKPAESAAAKTKIEKTIRVEVGRLESLLNLVGELVLQKNRIGALSRQVVDFEGATQDSREAFTQSSSDLDRVTGEIQLAVMRTRMQPLDKLFGKYPRLIRDLSKKTSKKIHLEIVGGETEVDRTVIEELGDPLVHLLRNSGDHGIGTPAQRLAEGKSEEGTITLVASQAGDHVLVKIIDDGSGLDREVLGAKAIEKGLTTPEELENLSDRDVFRFIFAAGFSTAEVVSDLSGRGVGMDVVRTNIERLKGSVDVEAVKGKGTTILIRIPLTVAIMPAMMVGVGTELYAIPLSNIVEIVRPEPNQLGSVDGKRVLRIRDSVLPMVSLADLFGTPEERREESRFAVVIELNEQRAALIVSRLVGQQEVVIKPLDSGYSGSAPVSGATVRDDGGVSLIIDVARVVSMAKESQAALAVA